MKIIYTDEYKPEDLPVWEREQVYNGMDVCVTAEILSTISPMQDEYTGPIYDFSRALQAPVLEMRLRGLRVDKARRAQVLDDFWDKREQLERQLEKIVLDGVGMPGFNWRSNKDLQVLFFDVLGIPPPRGKRSVNRNNLERFDAYIVARSIVRHMTAMRELSKKIDFLKTELDPDGRMRTSYNIAGTNTGRFSSSFSEFGTGGNLQNVEEQLRSIFISDPGFKFGKFDGAQIQSRIVGATEWNILRDGTYLDVCESGDLHTTVAMMTWPELAWSKDMAKNRKMAEQPFYRHYDYRFMCKKLGHGSNFDGQAPTLALQSRIPELAVVDFQRKYHKAFPAHRKLRDWTDDQLRRTATLLSLDGRKRQFWGRRGDPEMVREALAYNAQACEAKIVNSGMLNVWRHRDAILMKQDHDAVVVQYPEEQEDRIVPLVLEQLRYPMQLMHDRILEIPYDAQVGWNLGKFDPKKNPMGLKDYKGGDDRKREKELHILDRKPQR